MTLAAWSACSSPDCDNRNRANSASPQRRQPIRLRRRARFDEALGRELAGTRVHCATAYPGATDTDMMSTKDAGENLGFGRRPVDDVTAGIVAALEADESEINTSSPSRRGKQELNARDAKGVTVAISAKLTHLDAATRRHRSM